MLIDLIDHAMTLQEAVEARRLWTQGQVDGTRVRRGHRPGVSHPRHDPDGAMIGAACRRVDGMPIGLGGGRARPGVRFWPDVAERAR
ncbi:MAG: hypothetical protein M3Y41_02610 [Pseudomonadota bacterium]|nr:hypothetical protein [Pseudomonadota bacterium]